jgi:hypothetical protein
MILNLIINIINTGKRFLWSLHDSIYDRSIEPKRACRNMWQLW